MWEYIVIIFLILLFTFFIWKHLSSKRIKIDLNNKHVFITGGSSGIGFSIAKRVVDHGGKVTLIARDLKKLKDAKSELVTFKQEARVNIQSVDITGSEEVLDECVKGAERAQGPIYMLVNCAGFSYPIGFEKLERSHVKRMFDLNFCGGFYLTQLISNNMKQNGIGGKIVFVSSIAGLFGSYGYSVYAASKAAVNKMAEALYQELKPYGISVTVALPPDTDTPGFQEEQKTKPIECEKISESCGLFTPEEVAETLISDVFKNKFYSAIGMNGIILTTLCSDMSPVSSVFDLCFQVMFSGLFRLIGAFYLLSYERMIQQEHDKKMKKNL